MNITCQLYKGIMPSDLLLAIDIVLSKKIDQSETARVSTTVHAESLGSASLVS